MNTYQKPVVSPIQMMQKSFDIRRPEHPAQDEVRRVVGSYQLTADVKVDEQTLQKLGHIKGLIAFVAEIKRNGVVIGEGRGSAVLNSTQRFISRTVHSAFNSSLLGAMAVATKALDAFADPHEDIGLESVEAIQEKITDKQRSYLTELVQKKVRDESTIGWWMENISTMTKDRASVAIQELSGK